MRFHGLDINYLVTLEVLLTECHLTRASDRLCVTQPAISAALTKLRAHFDDPLLIRHGRQMRRSPFADEILGPLQNTVKQILGLVSARPTFEPSTAERIFKIVSSDYITATLLGRLLVQVSSIAPHVRIEQLPICDDSIAKFVNGEADALIQPKDVNDTSPFPARELFTEHFVCIAAVTNRTVGHSLTPEEFYAQPRVVPPYKKYWPDHYLDFKSATPGIPMPFPNIPLFVADSKYIAIIPERLACLFEPILAIRRVRLTTPIPRRTFTVRSHAAATVDPFNSWMLGQIESAARHQTQKPSPRGQVSRVVPILAAHL